MATLTHSAKPDLKIAVLLTKENIFSRLLLLELFNRKHNIDTIIVEKDPKFMKASESYLKNDLCVIPDFDTVILGRDIKVHSVKNHNDADCGRILREASPDLILLGGCRIIKDHILKTAKIGVLNTHPGILPEYRGMDIIMWSIYQGDPVGATCHFVDKGIDSGNIILQEELDYSGCKSILEVRVKALFLCAHLMHKAVILFQKDKSFKGVPQDHTKAKRYLTFPERLMRIVNTRINETIKNRH